MCFFVWSKMSTLCCQFFCQSESGLWGQSTAERPPVGQSAIQNARRQLVAATCLRILLNTTTADSVDWPIRSLMLKHQQRESTVCLCLKLSLKLCFKTISSLHSKIFQQLNFEIPMLLIRTSESFSASSDGRKNTPAACRTFFVPCFASWALLNGWEGCRTARKHLRSEVRVGRGGGRSFRVVVHPHWCTPTTGLHAAASLSTGEPTTLLCSSFLMFQRWERERRCSEGEDLAWSLKLSAACRKQS